MCLVADFLQEHEFRGSFLEEYRIALFGQEYFFDAFRERDDWRKGERQGSDGIVFYVFFQPFRHFPQGSYGVRELSFTAIDDNQVWPWILASNSSECTTSQYLFHRCEVVDFAGFKRFDAVFPVSFWIRFPIDED